MVPSVDNRPENSERLHLQRRATSGSTAGRTQPQEEPFPRVSPISSAVLRREKDLAVAPAEQTRTTRHRQERGPSKTGRIQKTDRPESRQKSLRRRNAVQETSGRREMTKV